MGDDKDHDPSPTVMISINPRSVFATRLQEFETAKRAGLLPNIEMKQMAEENLFTTLETYSICFRALGLDWPKRDYAKVGSIS